MGRLQQSCPIFLKHGQTNRAYPHLQDRYLRRDQTNHQGILSPYKSQRKATHPGDKKKETKNKNIKRVRGRKKKKTEKNKQNKRTKNAKEEKPKSQREETPREETNENRNKGEERSIVQPVLHRHRLRLQQTR